MKTDFATHATLKCSGVFGPGMLGRLSCVTNGETSIDTRHMQAMSELCDTGRD